MSRFLYLVRHGEQQDAEHGLPDGPLSARGVRQAHAIAERYRFYSYGDSSLLLP